MTLTKPSWIGHTISGRYKIEALLGQGGMSAVYKGTDPNLRRAVAVKLIHPHLASDPEFVRRFEVEAAAVAQLRHPNIVQVFDFDHDGDVYYMVLEFVEGETLQAHLKALNAAEQRLPLADVVKIMVDLCEAVDYAHQRGMIHRDLKPANVMLNPQGEAILTDFGVAKILGGEQHTATGAIIGTAMYMSPEQARGAHPDERADIYSLGIMLFEMVAGKCPFEADSALTVMMMHLNEPVPDIREINGTVPEALTAVIEKALEKDPANRYQTASEMAAALRAVDLHAQPTEAATFVEAAPERTLMEPSEPEAMPAGTLVDPSAAGAALAGTLVEPSVSSEAPPVQVPSIESASPAGVSQQIPLPAAAPAKAGSGINPLLIGGGLLGLVAVIGALVLALVVLPGGKGDGESPAAPPVAVAEVTEEIAVEPVAAVTEEPQPEGEVIVAEPPPTETPAPTSTPTSQVPPGVKYVLINDITADANGHYVVEYKAFEYEPQLPGEHVHFFFDTVPPEQAGVPGSGPWILYGGPNPFTQYTIYDRPPAATQMCALVANPDHSVQPDSGNCFDLPQ
jgi:serine/threonine protein kinase